jgi:signal transduction histidine kinase
MFRKLSLLFLILTTLACTNKKSKLSESQHINDSIFSLLKNKKVDSEKRKKNLSVAYRLNESEINDSVKNRNFLKISFEALKIKDSILFKNSNKKAYALSLKLKDTFGLGDFHWNYGSYYVKKEVLDSSYYHYYQAHKYFNLINHKNYTAKMLYNMAFIQSRLKDYTSSEAKLFEAISIYKSLNKNLSLYKCYNLLGVIYKDLEDYDNSLRYHNIALGFLDKVKNSNTYKQNSLNNLAFTYRNQKNYKKSIATFKEALKVDSLFYKDIKLFVRLTDNLAYAKLLNGDTLGIYKDFNKALSIRDSLNNKSGVVISKLHLSEYFAISKDTINSILYAKEANNLANKTKNNEDILSSLLLLSKIDKDNSSSYLNEHVLLTEKLEKHQRKLKNQFARIRYETDEHIEKGEKLLLQKTILIVSVIGLFLIFSLIYFLRAQKSKTKELLQESKQQSANEEIYRLLLKQQSKLEEGQLKEKHRISEELHDGVLGKIFGARMGLGFLEIEGDTQELQKHQEYIEDLQKIEEEIRDISHELKNEMLSSSNSYISLVKSLVEEKSKLGNFNFTLDSDESTFWNESSDTIKINIYRIIQEALQNIIKYAKAKNVSLVFNYFDENLKLAIKDDGIGFDLKGKNKGIGLTNIKSRIKALNGNVDIKSSQGKGTEIIIEIPNKL